MKGIKNILSACMKTEHQRKYMKIINNRNNIGQDVSL